MSYCLVSLPCSTSVFPFLLWIAVVKYLLYLVGPKINFIVLCSCVLNKRGMCIHFLLDTSTTSNKAFFLYKTFIFFLYYCTGCRNSSKMLNINSDSGYLCLVLGCNGNPSNFYSLFVMLILDF